SVEARRRSRRYTKSALRELPCGRCTSPSSLRKRGSPKRRHSCGSEEPKAHNSCACFRWILASARGTESWRHQTLSAALNVGGLASMRAAGRAAILCGRCVRCRVAVVQARRLCGSEVARSAVILAEARNQTRTTRALALDGSSRPQGGRRVGGTRP